MRSTLWLGLLGLCLPWILSGCAHFGTASLDPGDLAQSSFPERVELTDVPFFPQRRRQCGAAALATVLAYRDRTIDARQLEPKLYIPEKQGTLALEIQAQARQQGLLAYPLTASLESLLREIVAGNPVLVMQNLGLSWLPQWHFAVAVGYDLEHSELILRSSDQPRRRVALSTFTRTWGRADHWALVIVPPGQPPATASPLAFMQSASELEQVGQTGPAQTAYRAATQQWPNQARLAWLGLANLAFARKDYPQARAALVQALEHEPHQALLWNNLAFVLQAEGCRAQSQHAIDCASRLAPQQSWIQQSRRELANAKPEQIDQCSRVNLDCPI